MPNIHPFLTHFPIALLSVGFLFDLITTVLKRDEFQRFGWWSQLIGTIGLGATVVTGLLAKSNTTILHPAQETLQTHEQIAFLVSALTVVLLLWRVASKTQIPSRSRVLYLALSASTVALMWVGSWYGGELVYRFGSGVLLGR